MKQELQEALLAVKAGEEEKARLLLAQFLRGEPEHVPAWILLSKLSTSDVQKAAFLRKVLALDPDHAYAREELTRLGGASPPDVADELETSGEDAVPQDTAPEPAPEAVAPQPAEIAAEEQAPPSSQDELTDEPDIAPWHEDEITTVEPAEESLDWFLPEAEEEEAIESSLEQLSAEENRLPTSSEPRDYEAQARGDTIPPWMSEEDMAAQPATERVSSGANDGQGQEQELPDWLKEEPEADWLAKQEEQPGNGLLHASPDEEANPADTEARLAAAMASGQKQRSPKESSQTPPWVLTALAILTVIVFLLAVYAAATFLF